MDIKNQLSSLPSTNLDIKSPIFQPKPGWGGKSKKWLVRHFSSKILPTISLATFAVGIYLILR